MPSGLTFNVYGRDVSAGSTLRRVQGQADEASGHISGSFKKMGGLIAGAFAGAGVVSFFKDSFAEATEAQKVGAQTGAVLKSTGGAAHVTAGQIGNLATAISNKVGIDDEAIQSGENLLLTFTNVRNEVGKGNDIFNQATQAATDMSVALGTSLTSSAQMLGKALNDPTAGMAKLARAGVTFTQQQKDQVAAMQKSGNLLGAQKVILAELSKEFGGSAAAQATDAEKMQVAFKNLEEQVGTALLPVVSGLANFLTNNVIPAFSATVGWLQKNWHWLKYVAGAAAAMWVAYKAYSGAVVAIRAVQTALAAYRGEMVATNAAGAKFGTTLGSMKGKGLLAAAGFAAAMYGAYQLGSSLGKALDKGSAWSTVIDHLSGTMTSLTNAIRDANGAIDDNVRKTVQKQLEDSGLAAKAQTAGVGLDQLTAAVTGNDAAFKNVVDAWRATGAPADDTIVSLGLLHQGFKRATSDAADQSAKQKEVAKALGGTAAAQGTAKAAIDKTKDSMKTQTTVADALSTALDKLSGNNISAAQAELQFKDGLGQASQQVKDNGRSLSDNTAKGRSNREWLLNQIQSVNDVATAQQKAGYSVRGVTANMATNEASLRKAAYAAGFNKDQVDAMIRKYAAVPKNVSTKVSADTGHAWLDVDALRREAERTAVLPVHIAPDAHGIQVGRGVFSVTAYAQGTGYARGGRVMVGEHGPEFVNLPRGASVTSSTAAMSQARMSGGGGDTIINNYYTIQGSVWSERELVGALERGGRQTGRINIGSLVR